MSDRTQRQRSVTGRRMLNRTFPIVDATAPAERLAVFRIVASGFTLLYLLIRAPVFLELDTRDGPTFDGAGVFALWERSLPNGSVPVIWGFTVLIGAAAVLGLGYRISGPVFAIGVLVLASYRSSWGQLLHFENLFTMHLIVLAASPAADAVSLDARTPDSGVLGEGRRGRVRRLRRAEAYGFPLAIAGIIVVATYVIAGVAKLRYGGLEWITGDTLLHHIAYSAARLELLGGTPSPLARPAVQIPEILSWLAGASVVIELAAPMALLGGRARTVWVSAAWVFHLGTFALMLVGFPYPIFLAAFAPFFALERLIPAHHRAGPDAQRRSSLEINSTPGGTAV